MCDEVNSEIVKKISEYLHNIGLKATDLHPNNLGFLTKDNKVHYKDISFDFEILLFSKEKPIFLK